MGRTKAYGHRRQPARVLPSTSNFPLTMAGPREGERPAALLEPRPQERDRRHTGVGYEIAQNLDVPVLQMGEQLPDVLQLFASFLPVVAEQVIEVPKIFLDTTPQRLGDHLRQPQMVEQLVHVPTVVSYSSLQQLTAEQIVDIPVPGGDGGGRLAGSVGLLILMGICSGNIRENPEFHDLMRMDKAHWPRCLLWHGWLPMLSGVNGGSPWALDATESAAYLVEVALGRYSSSWVAESGDLLLLIEHMLNCRGLDTVRITKVKGHADDAMVLHGQVRQDDRLGNDAADEAADFGRRRVSPAVIDARRNLSGVCARWYPIILDLHRFFIAVSRAVVNHDGLGGTAPDPLVWSAGALRKRRRLVHAVRDRAFLPGPPGIWSSGWFQVPVAVIRAEDVALWPYTPCLLVKWVSFLSTLHWPVGDVDLGVGGVSYVELLILYELWAGERLSLEKAHPRYLRPERPISVSAVPVGPGIDIWRSCRFIGALTRSLCLAGQVCALLLRC